MTGRSAVRARLRVGIDFRSATAPEASGIGRYTSALVDALRASDACDLRLLRGPMPRLLGAPRKLRDEAVFALWRVAKADRVLGGCDVFHHADYRLTPVSSRTPQVMTMHDLSFMRDPSWFPAEHVPLVTQSTRHAAARFAGFIAPSQTTADDCREFLRIPENRIFVVPHGVSPSFFDQPRRPADPPYLLAVGTVEPRKNYARVVRAFDRAAARRPDVRLYVVGRWGWCFEDVREALAAAQAKDRIEFLSHVDDARLRELRAGCRAMLYPSLFEGFGLPVLEALAGGVPLLTSNVEPMRSVADGAALCVDPTDDDAVQTGIERLLDDDALCGALAAAGPVRARSYTWAACADRTLEAYRACT